VIIIGTDPWIYPVVNVAEIRVSCGQLAKVVGRFSAPGRGTSVILQLPNNKTLMVPTFWAIRATNLTLAKTVFGELAASAAEVAKRAVPRKLMEKLIAKNRLAIAKKHKLDDLAISLIELTGRANNW
jgi:hypothetical protein